jgi:hypothetical protein
MHMLYNSDSYAVVLFEDPAADAPATADAGSVLPSASGRGGYEIVDKFARKEIYISGELARTFRSGVEALIESGPSEEAIDAYLEGFSALMQQPLVLH